MTARHLYVHVPFCARRCSYCDFSIAVRRRVPVSEYLAALQRDIAMAEQEVEPATIYLGGGTPSRLGGGGLARLAALLPRSAGLEEFTVEANPEDVTPQAAREWVACGATRLSLGAQSFDASALAWMHRTHGAEAIGAAVRAARAAGFAEVSLDLIFALPAHLARDWRADLERAIALEPDHISLYGLTIEPGTAVARWVARGEAREADEGRYEEEYLLAHDVLPRAGYEFYEVSNAARPGHESRHNRAYWKLVPYLGIGPSAHSFDGVARWSNEPAYTSWLRRLAAGERPVANREVLSPEQQRLERTYLALRTREGLELDEYLAGKVEHWVKAGWGIVEGMKGREGNAGRFPFPLSPRPHLRLTPAGWLRLDELVASL